jgi:hypothetical protein
MAESGSGSYGYMRSGGGLKCLHQAIRREIGQALPLSDTISQATSNTETECLKTTATSTSIEQSGCDKTKKKKRKN